MQDLSQPRQQGDFYEILARTQIIEGREDPVCLVHVSKRMHEGIQNSELLIYEKTGNVSKLSSGEDGRFRNRCHRRHDAFANEA